MSTAGQCPAMFRENMESVGQTLDKDRFTVLPSDEMGVDSTRFRDQAESSD